MSTSERDQNFETLRIGALGGIAGGLAEIGWISAYGAATGAPLLPVARGIVVSTVPQVAASAWAPELGILIHSALAVVLGIGLAIAIRQLGSRQADRRSEFSVAILILLAVWSVNFLIVLPRTNPAFVHVLPFSVTLLSKLLFAISAAAIFRAKRLCG